MQCQDIERLIDRFVDNTLNEAELTQVRAHLNTCEACALLSLELEFTIALCKAYPELEPPPRLVERILEQTAGRYQSLSWREYLLELFRPLYASPRFAVGACLAAVSFSIVMNAVGVNFGEIRLSDLSPRNVVDAVNRTVNIAYDKGLRRLNDLKILYQIQSRIEEFRFEERSQAPEEKPELKSKEPAQQSSATGHLIAVRTPKNLKATL